MQMATCQTRANLARYWPIFDFDDTLAKTFAPSPNGVGVEEAYAYALRKLTGSATVLAEIGGVKNRAPLEIVRAAQEYGYVKGRGATTARYVEKLIRFKLEVLVREISSEWPQPCAGALEYLQELRRSKRPIVILSSGHEEFIRRTFKVWGLRPPDLIFSDDDVRLVRGLEPHHRCKPSPVLFDLLRLKASRLGVELLDPLAYAGDSPEKDGTLARNVGIPFWWFNPNGLLKPIGWRPSDLEIRDWRELCE